nr:MAG: DNA pilot protein [Microvirus sp.]
MVWQAIAGIGSSLLGGLFGRKGAKDQNEAQIASAREQMAFQERMSNTSHQRQMADLQAAGINPILSAKLGGADSPGGAQPNIVNTMAPLESSARSMGDKLYNFRVQDASVDNMKLQNDLLKEQIREKEIANARQGVVTPAWDAAGRLIAQVVPKVESWLTGKSGPSTDIVQDVLDNARDNAGILPAVHSAKSILDGKFELPVGTRDSEARKFSKGEKSWLQSFKDANSGASTLTEEKLQQYGIRRLEELRKKHGFMKQR